MTGWNPKNESKEIKDIVNEFWWKGFYHWNTKIQTVISRLALEVKSLREQNKINEQQKEYLFKLLKELAEYPKEFSDRAALGNEVETYKAFTDYENFVITTANKRMNIFDK